METPALQRILLVEDEVDIQMVAAMALEDLGGFQVEIAGSGGEALAKAQAFRPDLVLLDFMLPDLNGHQILEALRRLPGFEETPVAFMTARAQTMQVAEYRASGALDVITKPFVAMKLAETLQGIWDRYQASRLADST